MKRTHRLALCLSIVGLVLLGAGTAYAQTNEMSDQDIRILIESLKERVAELEAKVAKTEAQPHIEERVSQIEESIQKKEEASASDFRVYWRDSLRLETADKKFQLRIGGRIHHDFYWYDQEMNTKIMPGTSRAAGYTGDSQDGTLFRRARIYLSGTLYDNIEFKMQYDFAGGNANFRDVYMALHDLPIGSLKIGQFKEPFSLEELTSSNNITFMERALPVSAFSPSRSTGIMINNSHFDDRFTWAAGMFRHNTDAFGNTLDEDSGWNATARITGLPWYEENGRELIHLGLSYSHQNPDRTFRYRARPESGGAVRYLDTRHPFLNRDFRADSVNLWALEAAGQYGPFSLQGEYLLSDVDTIDAGNLNFDGYYIQASYFLTGEHRSYSKSSGVFGSVKPKRNFSFDGGLGAWELAARLSRLDLDDGPVYGGIERNITVGLNWYLNPNFRVMFNYVNANIDHALYDGDVNIFQTRFQFQF